MDRDTPDPRVCRTCGETWLAAFDTRCPHCGRWPGAEQRYRPIYWLRASAPPEALVLLAHTPEVIEAVLADGRADVPGPDGGWTAGADAGAPPLGVDGIERRDMPSRVPR